MRVKEDIIRCINLFEECTYDTVITIKDSHRNPYFNMVKKVGNYFKIANKSKHYIHNRQDAPKLFDVCTVCYISKCNFVTKSENLFQGKVGAVKIPINRSLDIDTHEDYEIAKFLYEKNIKYKF